MLIAALIGGGLYYRSHRTKALTDKDTIVVGDFDNKTGDAVFDDTLKTALDVSLRQSPYLTVLPDGEVAKTLQMMTLPANTKLTPEVARQLCQRAGSKAYIGGSIGSLGSEYVIGLKAVNCQSGDTLAEVQMTSLSKERVLDVLGAGASKLRGDLGESLVDLAGSTSRSNRRPQHHWTPSRHLAPAGIRSVGRVTLPRYLNLVLTYMALNRLDEAETAAKKMRALAPDVPNYPIYFLGFVRGDDDEMQHQLALAKAGKGDVESLMSAADDTTAYHGQLQKRRQTEVPTSNNEPAAMSQAKRALW